MYLTVGVTQSSKNRLLNRRTGLHPYPGFESRPLRSFDAMRCQEESKSAENQVVTANSANSTDDSTPSKQAVKSVNR